MAYRPVPHGITQPYGANPTGQLPADHPTIKKFGNYQPGGHSGVDFGAPHNTPVIAPEDMEITWADKSEKLPGDDSHNGWASRYYLSKTFPGICVVGETGAGAYVFAHLNRTDLNPGDVVKAGELIGYSGSTGLSTGPHLHLEWIPAPAQWGTGTYGRRDPVPRFTKPYRAPGAAAAAATKTPTPAPKENTAVKPYDVWAYVNAKVNGTKDAYALLTECVQLLRRIAQKLGA